MTPAFTFLRCWNSAATCAATRRSRRLALAVWLALLIGPAYGAPDAAHQAIMREAQEKYHLPAPTEVLGETEDAVAAGTRLIGPMASGASLETRPVADASFTRALRVDVTQPDGTWWHVMTQTLNTRLIRRGDALLASVWVRGEVPNEGGSEATLDLFMKEARPPYLEFISLHLTIGPHWQHLYLPVIAPRDCAPDEFQCGMSVAYARQRVEIAALTVLDFGSGVRLSSLPRPENQRFPYAGMAGDAAWRQAALARIEKYRKAPISVRVVDARGRPIPGARVQIVMTRHAFPWGCSLVPSYDLFPPASEDALHRKALPEFFRRFRHAAIDIDLKQPQWSQDTEAQKRRVIDGLKILRSHGMTIHAHVLYWPSFHYNEPLRQEAANPAALRRDLHAFIHDVVTRTAPYVDSWDVLNEPYHNHEMVDILGRDSMADAFRWAHEAAPSAKLQINEDNLHADPAEVKNLIALVRELRSQGAEIDGIGDQGHYDAPMDPAQILGMWDRLAAATGLPITITEFDAKFGEFADPSDEAAFVRDFTLAAFSDPNIHGFTMWGFTDGMHWKRHAPLYDAQMHLKPSGRAWMNLVYHAWWTEAHGIAPASGLWRTRGFLGDYRITVTARSQVRTITAALPAGGLRMTVTLP